MKTHLTALAAAISSLTLLTACGGGGGGSDGEVPQYTPSPVTYYSSSAGLWKGTAGDRVVSGVVAPDITAGYWFVYMAVDGTTPAGFYAGIGKDDNGSDSVNGVTGNLGSAKVQRFDFEGDTQIRWGAFNAQYPRTSVTSTEPTSPYTAASTLNGAFTPPGSTYELEMNASNYFPGAQGDLNMNGFTGIWDAQSNLGNFTGTSSLPTLGVTMHYTQGFSMDEATGKGSLFQLDVSTCTDNNGSGCTGLQGPLSGPYRNTAVNPVDKNLYKTAVPFVPTDGWTGQWTLQVNKASFDTNGNPIFEYVPVPMNITLRFPGGAPITAAALTTQYDPLYEEEALVSIIAGSYTAGWTGIDAVRYSTASVSIADNPGTPGDAFDGVISGSAAGSSCSYAGRIVPHISGGGNYYDVNKLFFSHAEGGTCPYGADVEFIGVAVYEDGKLTLTAKNAAGDKGVMVVATKP